ncbi:MAG: hypothetical protein U0Y68_12830 [Blastocatellia bacterium]
MNEKLTTEKKRLLLAVDEYEAIDAKVGAGVFPHDLLDTLRESIQTQRRLTWIFAGNHESYRIDACGMDFGIGQRAHD